MKAVFKKASNLDKKAIDLGLDELILMENAGLNLAKIAKKALRKKGIKRGRILILLGSGNNGADGLVAARHLKNAFCFVVDKNLKKSSLFERQEKIALNLNVNFLDKKPNFQSFDCIIDCIFGAGLNKDLNENLKTLLREVNSARGIKITCDIPTGLGFETCFKADITATMGVIKEILLEDYAKESVGKIKCVNLGLHSNSYNKNALNLLKNSQESNENCVNLEKDFVNSKGILQDFKEDGFSSFLLEKKDLALIKRGKNSNKGDFGHGLIAASASAGSLAGLAALNFGIGLVSLLKEKPFSPLIMQKASIESSVEAAALGMGLEDLGILDEPLLAKIPVILDANCFLSTKIKPFLQRQDVVLTPHPKEFTRLWQIAFNETITVQELQKNRFEFVDKFTKHFNAVLVLKGANTIIAQNELKFIVNQGSSALAKAGSGDALAGMILALLCAKFTPLNAAKNAVLAHALIAKKYKHNANSFDALKLIKGLKCL